ncbi:AraC family transcriptional regulator [Nonomuraea diastatica]|uniref:AraC family transcriptional regulator n=1 Tax=Nonomuraea diastatica TaxID=1848329 RepID=A0A4R4WWF9_9ACTN|nr:AraC family transcriptional regulator [Nonomuraea diastatica]TDD22012.1 AraC family transcriptional regulator [Nonomuraea diastatica]
MNVRYWRDPLWGGVDLMRARFTGHPFARHSHDTYAIGVVEEGLEEIAFPDGPRCTGAGEVVMIDPGVVHTGRARTPDGWTYRVLYPRPEQLAAIADEAGASGGPPAFTTWSAADERASALLRSFRRAYGLPPHAYVVQLRVRRARALLERGTPPAEAAVAAGFCDQSHLSRHFRRMVGVTPGAYQRGVLAGRPVSGTRG